MLRYISLGTPAVLERDRLLEILQGDADMFAQASAMQALCKSHGFTQAALAQHLHISQSTVGNKIRLLAYSARERELILEYNLTERHARALLSILPPRRARLLETAGNMRLNVRQTEELAEKYRNYDSDKANYTSLSFDSADLSVERVIAQTGASVDRLRACGTKIAYVIEQGNGWRRLTLTIKDERST